MNLLLDSALKATLILFAAWAASLAMRRASADARHTLWLAAILTVAMLPAALLIPQSAIPSAALLVVPASVAAGPAAAGRSLPRLFPIWLFLIWAAGASLMLVRLMTGIISAARITMSARSIDGILYSDRAAAPMTWGFLRPVVILPAYAAEWTDAERELVIRHEQAHITRHDWLCQILASVITAVFWFHPLMWVANYQLRREAEGAVDDFVLASGAAPSDYAGRLLDVARRLPSLAAPDVVIAMVRGPELETRVRSILDPSRRRAGAGIFVRCAIVVAAIALVVPIAVTRQKVHAQGKVYKVGKDVSQPSIIRKVEPEYTQEAKDAGIEGTVVIQGEVSPDGVAQNISVAKSLDPGLDANAVTAVSQWRFKPGMKDGEPVTVAVKIEVNFHLQ
jgi:TonB family protein